jgi:hypothetical protein
MAAGLKSGWAAQLPELPVRVPDPSDIGISIDVWNCIRAFLKRPAEDAKPVFNQQMYGVRRSVDEVAPIISWRR